MLAGSSLCISMSLKRINGCFPNRKVTISFREACPPAPLSFTFMSPDVPSASASSRRDPAAQMRPVGCTDLPAGGPLQNGAHCWWPEDQGGVDRTGPQGLALLLAASATWLGGSRHLSEPAEPRLEDRKVLFPPKVAGRLTTNTRGAPSPAPGVGPER